MSRPTPKETELCSLFDQLRARAYVTVCETVDQTTCIRHRLDPLRKYWSQLTQLALLEYLSTSTSCLCILIKAHPMGIA